MSSVVCPRVDYLKHMTLQGAQFGFRLDHIGLGQTPNGSRATSLNNHNRIGIRRLSGRSGAAANSEQMFVPHGAGEASTVSVLQSSASPMLPRTARASAPDERKL